LERTLAYLRDGGVFVNGDKDLVEQSLKVVAKNAVHDEAFQRRNDDVIALEYRDIKVNQSLSKSEVQ
jgi:hypothetical protein